MTVVVTNVGQEYAVDHMIDKTGAQTTRAEYVGWGTGATTPVVTGTDISTAATEARTLATVSKTGAGSTAKLQAVATITADGSKTITNAGLFTTAGSGSPPSGGSLVVWGDHAGVAVLLNDAIQYTITIDPS